MQPNFPPSNPPNNQGVPTISAPHLYYPYVAQPLNVPFTVPGLNGVPPFPPGLPGFPNLPGLPGLPLPPFPQAAPRPMIGVQTISAPPSVISQPASLVNNNTISRQPTNVAAVMAMSSANNINLFNNINTNCCFINATSDLLNKHIFTNALSGLPLTIFVGKVPVEFEDVKLAKMFESCGKISKFVRPVDPISSKSSTFAFITYAQAICAWRAVNILNGWVVDKDKNLQIVVKTGTKETTTINSIKQTEQEAVTALPPGFSIEDVYGPIRAAIELILTPNTVATEQTTLSESALKPVKSGTDINTSGYYKFVTRETVDSSNPEDEFGEKALYSEIEKFRLRQLQRDKNLEEQRREKVRERLVAIESSKKEQTHLKDGHKKVDTVADSVLAPSSSAQKRKPDEMDSEELEARKRRKLQVLQMLSGDGAAVENEEKKLSAPIKVAAATLAKKSKPSRLNSSSAVAEEEEQETKKEMVLLQFTEEELKQFARAQEEEEEGEVGEQREQAPSASVSTTITETKDTAQVSAEMLKKLAEKIPKDRDELFRHPINWQLLEENDILNKFLRAWIVQKTKEYLGEEVDSLTNFIASQLQSRCHPSELFNELSTVLDEDSENFVLKLWRMLIYYSLKCELEVN